MSRWWHYLFAVLAVLLVSAGAAAALATALVYPNLPSLDSLTDYRPKQPLRIFTEDGALISEFGEERRKVVRLADTPKALRQAIIAAEDERFYQHGGVDTMGVLRAALANVVSGGVKEGASTITMQVARNFFLSSEKSFRRKLNEALLAIKIEHTLSKDEILELYINQLYLGQRAYGFAAAASTYFGKPLQNLNLAEIAMLAGLPKAPSAYNPVVNPKRAKSRQLYVLGRMKTLGYINQAQYDAAKNQRLKIRYSPLTHEVEASHLAELVRQRMLQKYGESIYVTGMRVYTTLRYADQRAALDGVKKAVLEYHRRKGYAGPEGRIKLPDNRDEADQVMEDALAERREANGFLPGVIFAMDKKSIHVHLRNGDNIVLGPAEIKYAGNYISGKVSESQRLVRGSIVRVVRLGEKQPWQLTYLPEVEAGFIALSPDNGAVRAMVGSFDFARNQFNHVTQAWRQPGSSFKPFVYAAALERGITPATIFEDAPISIDPFETGGVTWEPKNYDGTMSGPTSLRDALTKSKNLVSIRVLQAATVPFTHEYITRFGFDMGHIPPYLTMALGAGEVTPLSLASAYAIFANGGRRITPWHLLKVTDKDGRVLESFTAPAATQVIDPRNAFIMANMMQDVIRRGTAAAAMRLGRSDLSGKTGTTNDHRDTWFAGFQASRVAVAWMGYDKPRPLGRRETGGVTALPMWIHYMGEALKGVPEMPLSPPPGVEIHRIDPATGESTEAEDGVAEYFYEEFPPGYKSAEDESDAADEEDTPAFSQDNETSF